MWCEISDDRINGKTRASQTPNGIIFKTIMVIKYNWLWARSNIQAVEIMIARVAPKILKYL